MEMFLSVRLYEISMACCASVSQTERPFQAKTQSTWALRDAVARAKASNGVNGAVRLTAPATAENMLMTLAR